MTTIKELYEWAVENGVENMGIGIQWADGGGTYYGDSFIDGESDLSVSVENARNGKKVCINWGSIMGIKKAYEDIKTLYRRNDFSIGNVLDIIERECPEVLEENASNGTRICKECNKEFTIHHPSQKFCSRKCRETFWNRKRAERYQDYLVNEFEEASILEDLQEW